MQKQKIIRIPKRRFLTPEFPFFIHHAHSVWPYLRNEHSENFFHIDYIAKGEVWCYLYGKRIALKKDDIIFHPPGRVFKLVDLPEEKTEIFSILFTFGLIDRGFSSFKELKSSPDFFYLRSFSMSSVHEFHLNKETGRKVRMLFDVMLSEYTARQAGWRLFIKAKFFELLATLNRSLEKAIPKEKKTAAPKGILKALDYLKGNYTEKVKLNDIACLAGMEITAFCRSFKKITGKTLIPYLTDLRLGKAAELLKNSNFSVTDICFESGGSDLSTFERYFKKRYGFSPGRYRKISQK